MTLRDAETAVRNDGTLDATHLTIRNNGQQGDSGFFAGGVDNRKSATLTALAFAPPSRCPLEDQRGFSRPRDGNHDGHQRCDIGAVEK